MGFGTLPIIILPFMLLLIVLIFVTLNRYIRYKERVALAQLGFSLDDMSRADAAGRRGNRGVLWGGVITATSGLALLLALGILAAATGVGVELAIDVGRVDALVRVVAGQRHPEVPRDRDDADLVGPVIHRRDHDRVGAPR